MKKHLTNTTPDYNNAPGELATLLDGDDVTWRGVAHPGHHQTRGRAHELDTAAGCGDYLLGPELHVGVGRHGIS